MLFWLFFFLLVVVEPVLVDDFRFLLLLGGRDVSGGATIRCHFWNKVVFKQSRGLRAYALCLDINSCIGSRMTHNCTKKKGNLA